LSGRRVHRDDDIHIETDKFGSQPTETVSSTPGVSVFDAGTLSFDPSEVAQALSKCIYLTGDRGVGDTC